MCTRTDFFRPGGPDTMSMFAVALLTLRESGVPGATPRTASRRRDLPGLTVSMPTVHILCSTRLNASPPPPCDDLGLAIAGDACDPSRPGPDHRVGLFQMRLFHASYWKLGVCTIGVPATPTSPASVRVPTAARLTSDIPGRHSPIGFLIGPSKVWPAPRPGGRASCVHFGSSCERHSDV